MQNWLQSTSSQACPSITLLVLISLITPVASAEAERVFSAMNRIKDDERASLGDRMLDNLLFISQHGPPLEEYDFQKAVYWWYTRDPRREKLGGGILAKLEQVYGQAPPLAPAAPAPAPPAAPEQVPAVAQAAPAAPREVINLAVDGMQADG